MHTRTGTLHRRGWLTGAAGLAALGTTHRLVRAGDPAGRPAGQPAPTPADGLGIGVIGARYQGSVIAAVARAHGRVVALADADRRVLDLSLVDGNVAKQTGLSPEAIYADVAAADRHVDYRRVLDNPRVTVVLIGSPDHWHAKMIVDAVQAGKDVYCEKPLTLTIDEGRAIRRAVEMSGRVVQVGSWQRSDHRFRTAVEMVRQGRIGTLEKVEVVLGRNVAGGPFHTAPVPDALDWNLWQGQAPDVPYVPERCHYTFRWWLDYSGGQITDWGAHHLDIAQWAIGSLPVGVEGSARFGDAVAGTAPADRYTVPVDFSVRYRYANGVEMTVADHGRNGILFTGTAGRLFVNRENLSGRPVDELAVHPLGRGSFLLYDFDNTTRPERSGKIEAIKNHMGNFFDCVASRRRPISDVESQHRSATTCHLGGIACRLGRTLRWDPEAERFPDDSEADALRSRPQRSGFEVRA